MVPAASGVGICSGILGEGQVGDVVDDADGEAGSSGSAFHEFVVNGEHGRGSGILGAETVAAADDA